MSIRFTHLAGVGAAIALLLLSQQAIAQTVDCAMSESCCNSCSPTCETGTCGDWEVGAHALYFTPITCPHAYASVFVEVTENDALNRTGQAQVTPCQAEWGFRLFGNYLSDCFFAGLSYQWFEVTTTRSIVTVAPAAVIVQGGQNLGPGKATGKVGIEYQNVDARLGAYLWQKCGSALYLYGNARWVDISYRRAARAVATTGIFNDIREKSQLEGGALGIGFGGEFDIWCDVGAFIDGNLLGVVAKRLLKDIRYRQFRAGALVQQQQEFYPSETCVIPEVDFRIGLNYTYACGCWKLVGEVGYEIDYFWQGAVFPNVIGANLAGGQNSRSFVPVCEDIGFSGLFVGCRLIF